MEAGKMPLQNMQALHSWCWFHMFLFYQLNIINKEEAIKKCSECSEDLQKH